MEIIQLTKDSNGLSLCLTAIPMGKDWQIVITGGEVPHLGAVTVSVARPSLANNQDISTTTSVLALVGHKEEFACRLVGEAIAKRLNTNVAVSGGIHNDNATADDINVFMKILESLIVEFIEKVAD